MQNWISNDALASASPISNDGLTVADIVDENGDSPVTSITADAPLVSFQNPANPNNWIIDIPYASGSQDGALHSGDWTYFDDKIGSVQSSAPITVNTTGTTATVGIPNAAVSDGYVSHADYLVFSGKLGSIVATAPLSASGTTSVTLSIPNSATSDGYLAHSDYLAFESKISSVSAASTTGNPMDVSTSGSAVTIDIPAATVSSNGYMTATQAANLANALLTTSTGTFATNIGVFNMESGSSQLSLFTSSPYSQLTHATAIALGAPKQDFQGTTIQLSGGYSSPITMNALFNLTISAPNIVMTGYPQASASNTLSGPLTQADWIAFNAMSRPLTNKYFEYYCNLNTLNVMTGPSIAPSASNQYFYSLILGIVCPSYFGGSFPGFFTGYRCGYMGNIDSTATVITPSNAGTNFPTALGVASFPNNNSPSGLATSTYFSIAPSLPFIINLGSSSALYQLRVSARTYSQTSEVPTDRSALFVGDNFSSNSSNYPTVVLGGHGYINQYVTAVSGSDKTTNTVTSAWSNPQIPLQFPPSSGRYVVPVCCTDTYQLDSSGNEYYRLADALAGLYSPNNVYPSSTSFFEYTEVFIEIRYMYS